MECHIIAILFFVLSAAGAEGAVVGLALYTDVIRPWEWDTPWKA